MDGGDIATRIEASIGTNAVMEGFFTGNLREVPVSIEVGVDDTLHLCGMIGLEPGTMDLVPGGIEAESRRTMENIRLTIEAHGASMDDVVKCTVMLADISKWGTFHEIWRTFFNDRCPARSAPGANGIALGARVEVECIAVIERDRDRRCDPTGRRHDG